MLWLFISNRKILDNGKIKVRYDNKSYIDTVSNFNYSNFCIISEVIKENKTYSSYSHSNLSKQELIKIFNDESIKYY